MGNISKKEYIQPPPHTNYVGAAYDLNDPNFLRNHKYSDPKGYYMCVNAANREGFLSFVSMFSFTTIISLLVNKKYGMAVIDTIKSDLLGHTKGLLSHTPMHVAIITCIIQNTIN